MLLNTFITETRNHAQKRSVYAKSTVAEAAKLPSGGQWGGAGQRKKLTAGDSVGAGMRVLTLGAPVAGDCPICRVPHKRPGKSKGQSRLNSERFTSCDQWKQLGIEAKVTQLQAVNGCCLCGDWTGSHQNHNCPSGSLHVSSAGRCTWPLCTVPRTSSPG